MGHSPDPIQVPTRGSCQLVCAGMDPLLQDPVCVFVAEDLPNGRRQGQN